MSRIYLLLFSTVGWAFGLPAQLPTTATARVRGVIADSLAPVRDAEVRLVAPEVNRALVTTSDSAGAFEFRGVAQGSWTLVVRQLGYRIHTQPVVVRGRGSHIVQVSMTAVAQGLDTVAVVEASLVPARYGPSSRLEGFYRRRARERGRFFTREEIEES